MLRNCTSLVIVVTLAASIASAADYVDLGDVAVGGDGTGSAVDRSGLHIASGQLVDPNTSGGHTEGGPLFTAIDGTAGAVDFPLVDGVFIPDRTTQIRSDGATFDFPNTEGDNHDSIRNAASHFSKAESEVLPIELADQPGVYRRGLGMHTNAGITFDLNAVRDAGYEFNRFVGVAGINFNAIDNVYTDFTVWVLLDGEVQYQQSFRRGGLIVDAIVVPITESDGFLTVVTTDYNVSNSVDHAAIADVALLLTPPAACCIPGQECQVLLEPDCFALGGRWLEYEPNCAGNPCEPYTFYAPGESNGWDTSTLMADQLDGTYHYDIIGFADPSPAEALFDILAVEGDWNSKVHAAGNQWLILDPNGDNTLILDTNTYADGWSPDTNRVMVAYEPSTSWTAVGNWQSQVGGSDWDNANPNTAMTPAGGDTYSFQAVLAEGGYEYKAVVTGTWNGIGTNSRNVNADSLSFNVPAEGATAVMWVDVIDGAIRVDVLPHAACCIPGQGCQVLDEPDCLSQGGRWLESEPNCAGNPCEPYTFYAPGESNGWDGAALMADPVDGTYRYDIVGFVDPSPPTTNFDILSVEGDWGSKVHPEGNQWLILDPNGDNTLILDTRYPFDIWSPQTNRVQVAYEPSTSWTAVGNWQSQVGGSDWDNANPNTLMTLDSGSVYRFDTFLVPGDYEYKAVVTGTWDGIGLNSRNVNATSLPFNIQAGGGDATMWVDVIKGTVMVDIVPPCREPADSNCDGFVNNGDIDAFVVAMSTGESDWRQYLIDHGHNVCDYRCANDTNGDGFVNGGDIDPFILMLTTQ